MLLAMMTVTMTMTMKVTMTMKMTMVMMMMMNYTLYKKSIVSLPNHSITEEVKKHQLMLEIQLSKLMMINHHLLTMVMMKNLAMTMTTTTTMNYTEKEDSLND